MSHSSIAIHQTSSRVGDVTRFVRINCDGIGLCHGLDILNRLGIQVPFRFRLGARLLLDAVASAEEIEVDEKDFERTLSAIASAQRRSTVAVRQELDRHGRLAELRDQLKREKALRGLLGEEPESTDTAEDQNQDEG